MTDEAVSPLRRRMIEDMTIRKLAPKTQHDYVQRVKNFAAFLGRSPDMASFEDVRRYQLHLVASGVGVPTVNQTVSTLRFFFRVTLRRYDIVEHATRLSAPADAVDRAATIHRCSSPHSHARGTDPGSHHGSRYRPRSQHDSGPHDATNRIRNVLAVHHRTSLFSARGYEPTYQQHRKRERKLHYGLLCSRPLKGPAEQSATCSKSKCQLAYECASVRRLPEKTLLPEQAILD
jgi:hypothetical protein